MGVDNQPDVKRGIAMDIGRQNWSRRQLLRGGATAAAGLGAWTIVGCGDDDNGGSKSTTTAGTGTRPGGSPAASATAAPKETPRTGGSLTAAQVSDVSFGTGYPFLFAAENPYLNYLPVEAMVRYVDDLTPQPWLVDLYEFSPDKTKLTARLKPNLKFHNGDPVTPEDVFFGIELINDPKKFNITGSFQLATLARLVTNMTKVDDHTMEFTFSAARPNINDLFTQLNVTQRSKFDALRTGKDVQGTGPFKFVSWSTGKSLTFAANKDWHRKDQNGGPYLDEITVRFYADQDAEGLGYAAGELDLILAPSASVAKDYKAKGLTFNAPKTGLTYLGLNVTNPMLKDARVRQAIFLAVDRDRVVNELGEGFGKVTAQPWPETSPAFDPALEGAHYDPAKAKSLLKEAGFTQSAPIALDARTPTYSSLAALLKENFDAIGVKIEIQPSEANAFVAKLRARQFTGMWVTTHAFSDLTPLTNFEQTLPYQVPNPSYYDSPDYVAIVKALGSLDPAGAEAKAQYQKFNKLFTEDPWIIPISPASRIDLIGPKVKGYGKYWVTPSSSPRFNEIWKA
ncbi:MAG: ABC transporter substrate-binding protein [Dehalococcoidia bacterium]|nr:ABC transporter substrate-binding protein [Dehalococcoidia bacterium]